MKLCSEIEAVITPDESELVTIEDFFLLSGIETEDLLASMDVPVRGNEPMFDFFNGGAYEEGPASWNPASPFSSLDFTGTYFNTSKSGAMITPSCFISTQHWSPARGDEIIFHDFNGIPHSRRVTDFVLMSRPAQAFNRVYVSILDSPVPEGVAVYRLVPFIDTSILESLEWGDGISDPPPREWVYGKCWQIVALARGGPTQISGVPVNEDPRWTLRQFSHFNKDLTSNILGETIAVARSSTTDWSYGFPIVYGELAGGSGDSGAIGWMLAPDGKELLLVYSGPNDIKGPNMFKKEIQDDLRETVKLLAEDVDEVQTYQVK